MPTSRIKKGMEALEKKWIVGMMKTLNPKPMISFLDFENRMKQQEIGNPALVLRFSDEV